MVAHEAARNFPLLQAHPNVPPNALEAVAVVGRAVHRKRFRDFHFVHAHNAVHLVMSGRIAVVDGGDGDGQ